MATAGEEGAQAKAARRHTVKGPPCRGPCSPADPINEHIRELFMNTVFMNMLLEAPDFHKQTRTHTNTVHELFMMFMNT